MRFCALFEKVRDLSVILANGVFNILYFSIDFLFIFSLFFNFIERLTPDRPLVK